MPRRTIPVRVAPARTRTTGLPASVPPVAAPPSVLPAPGEVGCRLCGRTAPAGRRFCACGAELAAAAPDPYHEPVRRPSWWAEWSANRAHRAAMRRAGAGARPVYDVPPAFGTMFVRVLVVLLLMGAVVSQVGPWGAELRQLVVEQVDRVR